MSLNGEVGATADDSSNPVLHRRRHDIVGATHIDVEGDPSVVPQHRKIHDGIHPESGVHDLIGIAHVHLHELAFLLLLIGDETGRVMEDSVGIGEIGEAEIVAPRKNPQRVGTEHSVDTQDEYLHINPPSPDRNP